MEDVYNEALKSNSSLVCRAKEVLLTSITSPSLKSCRFGDMVQLDIMATISMNSPRYDFGWYVAEDGGDALTGNCTINTLSEVGVYNVSNGFLSWLDDKSQPSDSCGDVLGESDSSVSIEDAYLARGILMPCQDINQDGHLDFSVCFTWRTADTDGACSPEGPYPGSVSKCDCATWDVDVTVEEDGASTCV
jgi:hypothetical protein